jgi:aquaporin Z
VKALRNHWREYAIEAGGLATFMVVASLCAVMLEHPASPVRRAVEDALVRRAAMGVLMGLTVIALVYSPWGARSGAHFNPALTLTFLRLGKVGPADAAWYVLAQFAGGVGGTALAALVLGPALVVPEVNFIATVPGPAGPAPAFLGELAISFGMVTLVLHMGANRATAGYTGLFAGALVATWITLEAPLSGMSMNPARSLGPALATGMTGDLWIYFTAPPLGMLLAGEAFAGVRGLGAVLCAKLNHRGPGPCLFRCHFGELPS